MKNGLSSATTTVLICNLQRVNHVLARKDRSTKSILLRVNKVLLEDIVDLIVLGDGTVVLNYNYWPFTLLFI